MTWQLYGQVTGAGDNRSLLRGCVALGSFREALKHIRWGKRTWQVYFHQEHCWPWKIAICTWQSRVGRYHTSWETLEVLVHPVGSWEMRDRKSKLPVEFRLVAFLILVNVVLVKLSGCFFIFIAFSSAIGLLYSQQSAMDQVSLFHRIQNIRDFNTRDTPKKTLKTQNVHQRVEMYSV